jgi:DNA-binding transcriptional LysR family regulator
VNLHHLEIFYYVARYRGISEAVRKFPYGIQQPAVSSQILQLESSLGTKLFHRRPFQLTPAGERLFAFVGPFFGNLAKVAGEIDGASAKFIRIGASGPALRHHLPNVLSRLRKAVPKLKLHLLDAAAPQLTDALREGEIDLAVTTLHEPLVAGLQSRPLLKLPLALLVPRASRLRSPGELWKQDTIDESLISLPANEPIAAGFQKGLRKLGVDWAPTMVVSSLDLVESYVARGFGFGASVLVPGVKEPPGVRRIPLDGFEPLAVGALWHGTPTPLVRTFIDAMTQYGQVLRDRV